MRLIATGALGAALVAGFWVLSGPSATPDPAAADAARSTVTPPQRRPEVIAPQAAIPAPIVDSSARVASVAQAEWTPPINPGQKSESAPLAGRQGEDAAHLHQAATPEQRQAALAWRDQQANLAVNSHPGLATAGTAPVKAGQAANKSGTSDSPV